MLTPSEKVGQGPSGDQAASPTHPQMTLPADWGPLVTPKMVAGFLACHVSTVMKMYYSHQLRGFPMNDAPKNRRGRKGVRIWSASVADLFVSPPENADDETPTAAGPEKVPEPAVEPKPKVKPRAGRRKTLRFEDRVLVRPPASASQNR
jgi:hypothetical protein